MIDEGDLLAAAAAAAGHARAGEQVAAVLAADAPGQPRVYLCALREPDAGGDSSLAWIAVDGEGRPVTEAVVVREAATVVGLCETAEEAALAPVAAELAEAARNAAALAAGHPGLRDALGAYAGALEDVAGTAGGLRVASAAYVDRVGAAALAVGRAFDTLRAEAEQLSATLSGTGGEDDDRLAAAVWAIVGQTVAAGRPDRFGEAVGGAAGALEALAQDVLDGYRIPLGGVEAR